MAFKLSKCFYQSHNDALDDHRRIRMDEYKRDYRKLETRYCDKHPREVYSMVCENCYEICCVSCVRNIGLCANGKYHFMELQYFTLDYRQ